MTMHRIPGLRLVVLSVLLLSCGSAFADCGPRIKTLDDLLKVGDLGAADRAVKEISAALECGPGERRAARATLARKLVEEAKRLQAGSEADRLVEAAAALNASWAAAMAYGDLNARRRAYADAALAYQEAINLIASEQAETGASGASQATIASLGRRADEARHLAASGANGRFVETPSDRNGAIGGVYSEVLHRGAEATRVPVPILFAYNSDELTAVGRDAAEEFVKLLQERRPSTVSVVGHTDRVGGHEFNLDLSLRRARRVAEFLRAGGIDAQIKVAGKGKTEPRQLADASAYDQTQIDELNRRVEFDWRQ